MADIQLQFMLKPLGEIGKATGYQYRAQASLFHGVQHGVRAQGQFESLLEYTRQR